MIKTASFAHADLDKSEVGKQKDVIRGICEEIFPLIEKSHSHFTTNIIYVLQLLLSESTSPMQFTF